MLDTELEKQCPYAPYTSVIMVIRHMRERNLKEPVTSQWLTTINIAEGNASRTIQALRFLNLLDEEGYITPNFKVIGNAPNNEYPELLGQTLQEAYKHVFTVLDPTTASDQQFDNAFRYYQPRAQRQRMIMLFKGLCREASIMAGGAPETIIRPRTASPKSSPKPSAPSNLTRKTQPKLDQLFQSDQYQTPGLPDIRSTLSTPSQELTILEGLLHQLPFEQKRWSQPRRDKWVQAMIATVDLLFEIRDPDEETSSQYMT